MAVINKDKYLKDIAAAVQREWMYFEKKDRVPVLMGTIEVYISDLSFDYDRGEICYNVANSRGDILASARGPRYLREVDVKVLSKLQPIVKKYHEMNLEREKNLGRMSSQMNDFARRFQYSF